MVRSLWTAATGMIAQQTNMDVISNNLANVNTYGYKRETVEFRSLLYQTIKNKATTTTGEAKPVGVQVGLGVRNSSITSQFKQGNQLTTGNDWDLCINGSGFFQVEMPDGSTNYTRNGVFVMAVGNDGHTLSTAEGYRILDAAGKPIVLDPKFDAAKISVNTYGEICYKDEKNNDVPTGVSIGLAQFNNPSGLEKTFGGYLRQSPASGQPRLESTDNALKKSVIAQGAVEGSNVQAIDEMVNMIVAQRAYEMSSKAITASDEMLQQANNLRR